MGAALRALVRHPFLLGIARSVDVVGALNEQSPYRRSDGPLHSDAASIGHDWAVVGNHIAVATAEAAERQRTES
jgi:hypothetical protein